MVTKILLGRRLIQFLLIMAILVPVELRDHKRKGSYRYDKRRTTSNKYTKTMCLDMGSTLRARHKTCFLRPDNGPCRADIVQWYYDAKIKKCFRFFWGGCQGNGNKFETELECQKYCFLDKNATQTAGIPHYCSVAFDFGTCFGAYNRWSWDTIDKTCKRRLYSGCGGNQNNFETRTECMKTCLTPPRNTLQGFGDNMMTTCFPIDFDDLKYKK